MTRAAPWLSVVIPTYQGAQFLAETLDSIASQWSEDIEVIAIDDGSTDGTLEILAPYRTRIGLRILEHSRTGNWVRNTERALNEARGEFLCMLHQDDLWLPTRVSSLRTAIAENSDVGLFLNSSWYIDEQGRHVGRWTVPLTPRMPLDPDRVLPHLIVQNFIALPAPVFRRSLWQEVDGMDDSLWFLADWKLWGALAARTRTVVLPDMLTAFRIHPASQTARRSHDADDLRAQYDAVIASMAGKLTPDCTKRQALRAAELNMGISMALALWSHGARAAALRECLRAWQIRPSVWHQFLRDSRIVERVVARLRCGIRGRSHPRKEASDVI